VGYGRSVNGHFPVHEPTAAEERQRQRQPRGHSTVRLEEEKEENYKKIFKKKRTA